MNLASSLICALATGMAACALPVATRAIEPRESVVVDLTVEMPDSRTLRADVSDADCPARKSCGDYYGIHGYVLAGFEKLGLAHRESCQGNHGARTCSVIELGGVVNSDSQRWTLFRAGHPSPYPYNRITREERPEKISYRFLPVSGH